MNRYCLFGLGVLAALVIGVGGADAAPAVFSSDGSSLFVPERERPALRRADLARRVVERADLSGATGGEPIDSVDLSNSGFVLCMTAHRIVAFDVAKGTCASVAGAFQGCEYEDFAYNPADGSILIAARVQAEGGGADAGTFVALHLKKGEDRPVRVFCRRVEYLEGPTFDRAGQLHFGYRGDLWMGRLQWSDLRPAEAGPVLVACRVAPLATLETAEGTPSQIGVRNVAVGAGRIYLHVRRMGGSGWGEIGRIAKPAPFDAESEGGAFCDLRARLGVYRAALGSYECLGEIGGASRLCASRDGGSIYFRTATDGGAIDWIVRGDGAPERLGWAIEIE